MYYVTKFYALTCVSEFFRTIRNFVASTNSGSGRNRVKHSARKRSRDEHFIAPRRLALTDTS